MMLRGWMDQHSFGFAVMGRLLGRLGRWFRNMWLALGDGRWRSQEICLGGPSLDGTVGTGAMKGIDSEKEEADAEPELWRMPESGWKEPGCAVWRSCGRSRAERSRSWSAGCWSAAGVLWKEPELLLLTAC